MCVCVCVCVCVHVCMRERGGEREVKGKRERGRRKIEVAKVDGQTNKYLDIYSYLYIIMYA